MNAFTLKIQDNAPVQSFLPSDQDLYFISFHFSISYNQDQFCLFSVREIAPSGNERKLQYNARSLHISNLLKKEGDKITYRIPIDKNYLPGKYRYEFQLEDKTGVATESQIKEVILDRAPHPQFFIEAIHPITSRVGEKIIIRGSGFENPDGRLPALAIGQINILDFEFTDSEIIARLPEGAVSGKIMLTNEKGRLNSNEEVKIQTNLSLWCSGPDIMIPGQQMHFHLSGTTLRNDQFIWKVNGNQYGDASIGLIDDKGIYTAPKQLTGEMQVTISAEPIMNMEASGAQKNIIVSNPLLSDQDQVLLSEYGGTFQSSDGKVFMRFPALPFNESLKSPVIESRFVVPQMDLIMPEPYFLPLVWLKISGEKSKLYENLIELSITLPYSFDPGTEFQILIKNELGEFEESFYYLYADKTGLSAYNILELGELLVAESVLTLKEDLQIKWFEPEIESLSVPELPNGIEEGTTIPVLIRGQNLGPFKNRPSAVYLVDTDLEQYLEIGTVYGDQAGTALGFTVKIKPIANNIPLLKPGQTRGVSFRIDNNGSYVDTNPKNFVILGLPELIVEPNPNSNLYTLDGRRIDQVIGGRQRYSMIRVKPGATLGLGGAIQTINASGESFPMNNAIEIERHYGELPQSVKTEHGPNIKLFAPFNDRTELEVVGEVIVDGILYFAGERGGENPRISGLPHIQRGQLKLGAPAAQYNSISPNNPTVTLSGGASGSGGQTASGKTNDGMDAGNNIPDLGLGRRAKGNVVGGVNVAGAGSRFDAIVVQLGSYFQFILTIRKLVSWGDSISEFVLSKPEEKKRTIGSALGIFSKTTSTAGGFAKLFSPTTEQENQSRRYSGLGGHGGFIPPNTSAILPVDDRILPGSGGGGGAGGGSSSFEERLYFITVNSSKETGGAGGGGGGAAGALRLTSGSSIRVKRGGAIMASGGRGGYGESQGATRSPGGGGGGGAGGVAKFQGQYFQNEGTVNFSGGSKAGGLLAQSGIPAPYNNGRFAMLPDFDGGHDGGFVYYGTTEISLDTNVVVVCWPSGRVKVILELSFVLGIKGIGTLIHFPFFSRDIIAKGLLVISDDNRVIATSTVDFVSGNPSIFELGEIIDLNTIPGFNPIFDKPTSVAQSPRSPHNIFVSVVHTMPFVNDALAISRVHKFDLGGNYIGKVFEMHTIDSPNALAGPGHLRDIAFTRDGKLLGTVSPNPRVANYPAPGIHELNINTSLPVSKLIIPYQGISLPSMAIYQGLEKDMIYLATFPGTQKFIDRYEFDNNRRSWRKSAQLMFALETISKVGEPGLLRIDGVVPGSNSPVIQYNDIDLPNYYFPRDTNNPVYHKEPVIGSFSRPFGIIPRFENLVTNQRMIKVYGHGASPFTEIEINGTSEVNPGKVQKGGGTASSSGQFEVQVELDPGFNLLWAETNIGGDVHELLKRHILYIPIP